MRWWWLCGVVLHIAAHIRFALTFMSQPSGHHECVQLSHGYLIYIIQLCTFFSLISKNEVHICNAHSTLAIPFGVLYFVCALLGGSKVKLEKTYFLFRFSKV